MAAKKKTESLPSLIGADPITTLRGAGEKVAGLVAQVAGPQVRDLWFTPPRSLIDRRYRPKLAEAEPGRLATVAVKILDHRMAPRDTRKPHRVVVSDGTAKMEVTLFGMPREFVESRLPIGQVRILSGVIGEFNGVLQMQQPDKILKLDEIADLVLVEPVYPLTAGLGAKVMAKIAGEAMKQLPPLKDWLPERLLAERGWPEWSDALRHIHDPKSETDLDPQAPARQRLAFDELLAGQLAYVLARNARKRRTTGHAWEGMNPEGRLYAEIQKALPFDLTGDQKKAVTAIVDDVTSPGFMQRLVQGDVGSGKTMVALSAAAAFAECGMQTAMMAPTDLLCRQHYFSLRPICEQVGIRIGLLTGDMPAAERRMILADLRSGDIDFVIGTHALFSKDVKYNGLGLAVIDEQHRFGVEQRAALTAKGRNGQAHLLMMTATPIPRTMTMTAFGEMDVSILREKPPGRKPVQTSVMPDDKFGGMLDGIRRKLDAGEQIYWVCPLIENSDVDPEEIDPLDAQEPVDGASTVEEWQRPTLENRMRVFEEAFGADRISVIHGGMPFTEREKAMSAFNAGETRMLVATTVIEVGVNNPNATVIVIDGAENFGLSQLHQLRGRVGRGELGGHCVLMYGPNTSKEGLARLSVMKSTDDGFLIAEEDFRLRGFGDVGGTRQSGHNRYAMADLQHHGDLLLEAHALATEIVAADPMLLGDAGLRLRTLLEMNGHVPAGPGVTHEQEKIPAFTA